jgi:hypothetical protein
MTPAQFKKLALAVPGAEEHSHMGHPDFRLPKKGRIFASLQPAKGIAMVVLEREHQAALVERDPETFLLFGGWSKNGSTGIALKRAKTAEVKDLLREAFRVVAARR